MASAAAGLPVAWAQQAADTGAEDRLAEIVVTAQKREQNLQDVGTSVTAFDANALARLGLHDVTDIVGQVPGLQFNQFGATVTIYNIRGISQNDFGDLGLSNSNANSGGNPAQDFNFGGSNNQFDFMDLNMPAASELMPENMGQLAKKAAKEQLKKLIAKTDIQYSESFEGDGREIHAHACKIGLEGVVSKVADSLYTSGRGNDWVKKTCAQRETLMIAGFALDGTKWDGIYLSRRKGKDLVYAGKVDHGFDKTSAAELRRRLTPLIRKTQPYSKPIAHKAFWVEPELLAEIEYRAKSAEGKVRHPFFKGLREDV